MFPVLRIARLACLAVLLAGAGPLLAADTGKPDAMTADGGRYYGPLAGGRMHGRGRIEWANGARYEGELADGLFSGRGRLQYAGGDVYEGEFREGLFNGQGRLKGRTSTYQGEFRRGMFAGQGELVYDDGGKYRGAFDSGRFHGKGRYESAEGESYEGDFDRGEFSGTGTLARKDGARYRGTFLKWRQHGKGRFEDPEGNVFEGQFVNGDLEGVGRATGKNGESYEGEFRQWRFHGKGVLRMPNGDVYKGGFDRGVFEGEGALTYAKPRPDGRTQESGTWQRGVLPNEKERQQARRNVETALYSQRALLDRALVAIEPADPARINLYLLAVAGDGTQEVFRREVEFVREQFAQRFGTRGRALALINSRNTVATAPMATLTSIRQSLKVIASRMDRERDILFLFLTSHGSKEHELSLNQSSMDLADLSAAELGVVLKETGIRWKVVVVSACYGGGFIDPLKDEHTLIITAARHDRQSFGCSDDNDFTYFGRAFFKEALPRSGSFRDAFHKAEALVREWEIKDAKEAGKPATREGVSLPQMFNPAPIDDHLGRWFAQPPAAK
jgi:hypothetical protein